eukprot:PITA_02570
MASSGMIMIEKFNGQSFELWKLNMEDLLVDKDQWITVDPGTKPTTVSDEEWKKLDRKAKSMIQLCVSNSAFLNVYNLRMKDGDSMIENMNALNILVSKLAFVDIKILNEDKCISLLCSIPDSWDSLVIAIGGNESALQFNEIVSTFLTKEMRRKNMES